MTKSDRPAYVRTYLLFVGIGDGDYRPPPPPLATIRLPRQYLISPQRPSDLLLISHYPLAWNFLIPMIIVPIVTSSHTEHRHSLCHLFCLLRIEHHAQYGSQRMWGCGWVVGRWDRGGHRPPGTSVERDAIFESWPSAHSDADNVLVEPNRRTIAAAAVADGGVHGCW